jgi:YbbR domain-containing protein
MKKRLFHNVELKLAAVVFAFVLWLIVGAREETSAVFLVPLELRDAPVDMAIASRSSENLEVVVSGPKDSVKMLSPGLLRAELDLSEAKEGLNGFGVKPEDVKAPGGFKVVEVKPSNVEVSLERLGIATVPIRAHLSGSLDAGLDVKSVAVQPAEVEVIGRESVINALKAVETRAIDVSGMRSSRVARVFVEIPDGAARVEPERVSVAIRIGKGNAKK